MVRSKSIIATPPGATIKEQLLDRKLSQKEFAIRMDLSEKHISRLINGDVQLTPEVAVRLEMVLGITAGFWNKLEAIYREKLVKAQEENEMYADIELAKKIPYNEMVKNGWLEKATKPQEKVIALRKFFEVVKLDLLMNTSVNRIACRKMSDTEKSNFALLAWAQRAKIEARNVETGLINLKKLKMLIPEIRNMTRMAPDVFCPSLLRMLAECGVALVFLPHIDGSFLHGATFCDGKKIVVGLTVRGRDADKFWFSLFHELAHILKGHINKSTGTTQEDEDEADDFSKNVLIDNKEFQKFTHSKAFSLSDLADFADKMNIDVGIVIGRLQKEGFVPYNRYNEMKTKYSILV